MKNSKPIRGITAPTPRLTLLGITLIALLIALPVGGLIGLIDFLL